MKNHTILVVDDTPANIDILVELLGAYDVVVSLNGKDALSIARERPVDLVLLDIMMPGMDGFRVCEALKSDPKTAQVPVVFITAKADEESIEHAYDAGGADYVTKPFKPREVLARVRFQIERAEHIKKLEFYASRDPMTGIYNRRKFFEQAQRLFDLTSQGVFVGMIFDIDKFKHLNDTYGHAAGDAIIQGVTGAVGEMLDSEKVFGRIGGEEFAIVGWYADEKEALEQMERCRKAVGRRQVVHEGVTLHCTVSCGLASKKSVTDTLDGILMEADKALYSAKGGGRNRTIIRR